MQFTEPIILENLTGLNSGIEITYKPRGCHSFSFLSEQREEIEKMWQRVQNDQSDVQRLFDQPLFQFIDYKHRKQADRSIL